jgi:hypothetical protein
MKDVYEFLDVDTTYVAPALNVKANSAASKKHVGKSKWIYYASRLFGKLGFRSVKRWLERLNKKDYPVMNKETHARLLAYYSDSISALEVLTQRDLPDWHRNPTGV